MIVVVQPRFFACRWDRVRTWFAAGFWGGIAHGAPERRGNKALPMGTMRAAAVKFVPAGGALNFVEFVEMSPSNAADEALELGKKNLIYVRGKFRPWEARTGC